MNFLSLPRGVREPPFQPWSFETFSSTIVKKILGLVKFSKILSLCPGVLKSYNVQDISFSLYTENMTECKNTTECTKMTERAS